MYLKVTAIGNLGKDPVTTELKGGSSVTNFSMAVTQKNRDEEPETTWLNVAVFGKQGENCAKYLSKGSKLFVEGRLKLRKWKDKDGVEQTSVDVIATETQFIGSKADSAESKAETVTTDSKDDEEFDSSPF